MLFLKKKFLNINIFALLSNNIDLLSLFFKWIKVFYNNKISIKSLLVVLDFLNKNPKYWKKNIIYFIVSIKLVFIYKYNIFYIFYRYFKVNIWHYLNNLV